MTRPAIDQRKQPDTPRRRRAQLAMLAWGCVLVAALFAMSATTVSRSAVISIKGLDPPYYFGTAHALLFHHDFDLRSEFQVFKPIETGGAAWRSRNRNGLPGSPYAIGYSLLSIPFLVAGTASDRIFGRSADGYSAAALFCYFLANVIFVVIGMVCLSRFLQVIGAAPWQAALLTLAMWFATTVGYYTFSPMPHAATFMMSAAFLLMWWRIKESGKVRAWLVLGLCGGLLSICRWQDVLFLLGPPLCELLRRRKLIALRKWFAYGAAVVVCWIPQIAQWEALYGRYLTNPQGPGFLQFPPRFMAQVLLSSNHGWFIWTPITVAGVAGLFYGARKSASLYWPWIIVITLEVGVMGSIPNYWNCAESFGIRSLTSCVPLIAWGIATLMLNLRRRVFKMLLAGFIVVCMVYTTLFALQFRLDLIPRDGPLTLSELLWDKLFLKNAYQRHLNLPVTRSHQAESPTTPSGRPVNAETNAR
jgi:hypothetical protein